MTTISGMVRGLPDLTIKKVVTQLKEMDNFKSTNFTIADKTVTVTNWPDNAKRNLLKGFWQK